MSTTPEIAVDERYRPSPQLSALRIDGSTVDHDSAESPAGSLAAFATALMVGATAALAVWFAADQIDTLATTAAIAGGSTALVALPTIWLLIIRPARNREAEVESRVLEAQVELVGDRADRTARRELDRALDQAEDEEAALVVIRHALANRFTGRPIEVHLVDSVDPILVVQVALHRPEGSLGHRSSPWDPIATRTGVTLVYDTTERVDACAHLAERAGSPCSAVAVPLIAAGRILGLVYAFGPPGVTPDKNDVAMLEEFGSTMAAHLAATRTTGPTTESNSIDPLTGLPDRAAMQSRIVKLLADRAPFSVAIVDIDNFTDFNETHGPTIGDLALSLLGRVARRTIRPHDLVGRIGGDELLFVMPDTSPEDTTRAIERMSEEMFVSQSTSQGSPRFTISAGVVGSGAGRTIDSILETAAAALRSARHLGGNRAIVGEPVSEPS